MRKIKIFTHDSSEALEELVNDWLEANQWGVSVIEMFQSESSGGLTITIYYKDID